MEPATVWTRPARWLRTVTVALNLIATVWIIALLVMINVDVFSLNVLDRSIVGVKEAVGVSIAGIVFLQLAETLRSGRHIRSDMFLARMKRTRPRIGLGMDAVYHLAGRGGDGFHRLVRHPDGGDGLPKLLLRGHTGGLYPADLARAGHRRAWGLGHLSAISAARRRLRVPGHQWPGR